MINELGIGESFTPFFCILLIALGIILLIPKTFLFGNLLNIIFIDLIMSLLLPLIKYLFRD